MCTRKLAMQKSRVVKQTRAKLCVSLLKTGENFFPFSNEKSVSSSSFCTLSVAEEEEEDKIFVFGH